MCSVTLQGRVNARKASMTAIISIRLLVVKGSPPNRVFSTAPRFNKTPQPPGPGLPLQAPSVQISTVSSVCIAEMIKVDGVRW